MKSRSESQDPTMSAPVHGVRRNKLLCLCLLAAACQLFATVFVEPFLGAPRRPSRVPRSAVPVGELNIGDKYEGTVVSVARFGAFIDFGCEAQGLVHISQLKDGFVEDVHSEVSEGQSVDVWVKSVDIDGNKIGLTMVESKVSGGGGGRPRADLSVFQPLVGGEKITGIVKGVRQFGAFVEVEVDGQVAQGLVHVSQLSDEYVDDVYSLVSEGDEVKVTVLSVELDSGKMSLSMKTEA